MASNEESRKFTPRGISFLTTRAAVVLTLSAGMAVATCPVASAQDATAKPANKETAAQPLYDENADAKEQIAAALARAQKENKRVLVQWGGNWCHWCTKLHTTMTTDAKIKRTVLYEYEVVHIDAGRPTDDEPKGKNIGYAASLGANIDGFPYLTILASDGTPVTHQETGSLEVVDETGKNLQKHDATRVNEFLVAHKAEPLYAKAVLDAGVLRARDENKLVFMHLGAPWCTWCHRLEGWMAQPEVKKTMDKQFIDVKIDVDRMTGGKELAAERFPSSQSGGIPWFAFLNGDGAETTNSLIDGKTNVGFPVQDEEVAHFEKMLREKATRLTDAEIDFLMESLRKAGAPFKR